MSPAQNRSIEAVQSRPDGLDLDVQRDDLGTAVCVEVARAVAGFDERPFLEGSVAEIDRLATSQRLALSEADADTYGDDELTETAGYLHSLRFVAERAILDVEAQGAVDDSERLCEAVTDELIAFHVPQARDRVDVEYERRIDGASAAKRRYYRGVVRALHQIIDAVEVTLQTTALTALRRIELSSDFGRLAALLFVGTVRPSVIRFDRSFVEVLGSNLSGRLGEAGVVQVSNSSTLSLTEAGTTEIRGRLPLRASA